jgi:DNA polymerase-3 subunit alpha
LVRRAAALGYGGVVLTDWMSLTGALEWVEAAAEAGVVGLVGVTLPVAESPPWAVRVVGRSPDAWGVLTTLATAGTLADWAQLADAPVAVLLPPGAPSTAAEAARLRRLPVFQLVPTPDSPWLEGAVPLAAPPFRFGPGERRAWELLVRLAREPLRDGVEWRGAEAVREWFGAGHPAVAGWAVWADLQACPAIPNLEPRLPAWEDPSGRPPAAVLREWAESGLAARLNPLPDAYRARLDEELAIIEELGVAAYFLIVADLVRFAKRQGIGIGPGRGSAAASLVAWALGITAIDPLAWGLVFERFLNPARKSLPDIDLDVEDVRRGELVRYLQDRYGRERVAQIGTYGTFGARAALRDAGRVLGVDPAWVDRLARLVPREPDITLKEARSRVPDLDRGLADPALGDLAAVAEAWEGQPRHPSIHAAAVVVAPGPIGSFSPLRTEGESVVTALPMQDLEQLGLLKLDLLGLRTLSVIRATRAAVPAATPDLEAVPPADPDTLALLAHGETEGVFQLDGRGVKDLLSRLAPARIDDVMLTVALFRPGPMEHIGEYLAFRQARLRDGLPPPGLEDTGGILVFQEQLMALVRETAGYSWAEADLFRRAVSKKDRALLEGERARFVQRAMARGLSREAAEDTWRRIAAFADYGFNKAHAVAYGWLAYYVAFLKAHWPWAFWAAELSTRGHGEPLGRAVQAAFREGVDILPPHVNRSEERPVPEGEAVRLALDAVRGVGQEAAARIVAVWRSGGPYRDLEDFRRRVGADWYGRVGAALQAAGALADLAGAGESQPPLGGQLTLWDEADPAPRDAAPVADVDAAFGWPWPRSDGCVYVVVERRDPAIERAIVETAQARPGPDRLVVAERGARSGRPLSYRVAGTLKTLRALYRIPGVVGASRGSLASGIS